jgi:hypothetical protein
MEIKNLGASNPLSSGGKNNGLSASAISLGFDQIRKIRQDFEQDVEGLRGKLGGNEHQTMLVAMYEGTEQLLNRSLPEFAVSEYLEGLKLAAQDLRQQGVYGSEYQQRLFEQSRSMLARI